MSCEVSEFELCVRWCVQIVICEELKKQAHPVASMVDMPIHAGPRAK